MDFQLFETKLANHKIFKDIKKSLKDNCHGKLRNLLELKDEVLYVWNSIENCLYSVNLKRLEEDAEETPYQKLHLVSPPAFAVDRIIASECGSRLCLWGSRGVMVMELPTRWNRGGLFDSGSKSVLCKSVTLDERFLYSQGEVHRVHWHPKSLSHVLVLLSDNTMRLYNIALKTGPKLVKIFTIGPKPSGALGQTVLDSLGDTAVDFTPTPDNEYLLVLSGNGDVYMMECDLDTKSAIRAKLQGPLPMYPPADDNYGSESCSITALGGVNSPPIVVIASASAALYHCLLLPNSVDREEDEGFALYVVESVELNIVLNSDETPLNYVYPVHLYPAGRGAYVCVQAGGAHAVRVPPAAALQHYLSAEDDEIETALQSICSKQSSARHLICSGRNPPLGIALTPPPLQTLIILCAGGDVLTRALGPYDIEEQLYKDIQLNNTALAQDELTDILREKQKISFSHIIHEVLERKVSQPILKMEDTQGTQHCLELLTQATVRLRGEYILKQQLACDVITRKMAALKALTQQHREWLQELQTEIEDVKATTAAIKEKWILAEKHQDDIKYRCSSVFRAVRAGCGPSEAEREQMEQLQAARRQAADLASRLADTKDLLRGDALQKKKWQEEYTKKNTVLGKTHSDSISSILQQQTKQISSIIEETKILKDQLGLV